MANVKELESTTLSIEVEKGLDKDGNPAYKKKNFSGIKGEAALDNVYAVANAIAGVLEENTRSYFLNETSIIK